MKKMKIAALLAAGVLALTACGQEAKETAAETTAAETTTAEAAAETEGGSSAAEESAEEGSEVEVAEEETLSAEEDAALAENTAHILAEALQESIDEATAEDLAVLAAYPCYVGVGEGVVVNNEEEFLAIDLSEYMTDEMKAAIKNADIASLEMTEAGLVVGAESGHPNITFGIAEDGTVGITGINP